ncbi:MAG: S-formylglutathione hydrolase [Rhodospirillales bacterium]|nr:S-formylglutathione hydrolase [Rhodospirillales bacterium]
MTIITVSEQKAFGGSQGVYRHSSKETACDMEFSLFTPPAAAQGPVPVVYYLSGLTCSQDNVTTKGGFQRMAAELGLCIVCPDTSPRGAGYAGEDDSYDFGSGAGFYVDATQSPWSGMYRMYSYVSSELPALIAEHFPVDPNRSGIFGHSMGGHGALTIALKNPATYRSVSAFAPIVAPMQCPWGEKALAGYLGPDRETWRTYDATELVASGCRVNSPILIDQGSADGFLEEQLKPQLFEQACRTAGQALTLRMQDGYDHSYYFMATFMEDHLRHHAALLKD